MKKCGCIVMAGGVGSRLGMNGPKGIFPLQGKSLFQWILEKIPATVPIAIMTSSLNHEETVRFFTKHNSFGLRVAFFKQGMLPLQDENRKTLEIKGPDGNGGLFRSFLQSGILHEWKKEGIEIASVIPVDNPLALGFDAEFLMASQEMEAALKCVKRRRADDSMGAIIESEGKVRVIEYTELDPTKKYPYSNIGQFAFSLEFMEKMGAVQLPLHWVQKQIQIGSVIKNIWKGEQFIFDALAFATRVKTFLVPRETNYAPLKRKENIAEIEEVLKKVLRVQ